MKRRILALITAFVMVVTMLPASAFAEGTGEGASGTEPDGTPSTSTVTKEIDSNEDLIDAIKNQADNQVWLFTKEGPYDVKTEETDGRYPTKEISGGSAFVFPIWANNITIKKDNGVGDVTVTSSAVAPAEGGGVWDWQNFITVAGDGVTIDGINITANKNEYYHNVSNKAIEVRGSNFTIKDSTLNALTNESGKNCSGSIYFSGSDVGAATVENVNMASFISCRQTTGTVNVTNVEQDYTDFYWDKEYAAEGYKYGVPSNAGIAVNVTGLTMTVDKNADLQAQVFGESLSKDTTVKLNGEFTLDNTLNINKSVSIIGDGNTVIKSSKNLETLIQVAGNAVDFSMEQIKLSGLESNEDYNNSTGIRIGDNNGTPANTGKVIITKCEFANFTKNGIKLNGGNATISGNTITCKPVPGATGNGIVVDFGATATIENNDITGYHSNNEKWSSTGILVLRSGHINKVIGNTITDCDNGIVKSLDYDSPEDNTYLTPDAERNNTFVGCENNVDAAFDLAKEVAAAQPGAVITLPGNVKLDSMLVINTEGITIDLNGYTITASDDFKGSYDNDKHLVQVYGDNCTIKSGTLETTDANKHGINIYGAENFVMEDMTVDHTNAFKGTAVQINGSTVTMKGDIVIIPGPKGSFSGGINVDNKVNSDAVGSHLTFAEGTDVKFEGGFYGIKMESTMPDATVEVEFDPNVDITGTAINVIGNLAGEEGKITDPENADLVYDGGWYVGNEIKFIGGENATVSGSTDQDVKAGTEIDPVTYTAKSGYYFTSATGKNGIKAELSADKKTIKYSGTPDADTTIVVPSAVEEPPVIVYPVISRIAAIADQEYTGSAITPALTVYDTDGNIISSNNYTATYTNNVEPGTATVTVTGKAGVMGSATATFTIVKKEDPQPPQPEKPGKVEITKTSSDFGRIRVYFDKVAAVGDNTMRYQIQSQKVGSDVVKTQYATVGYSYATVRDLAYNAKYNIKVRAYYVDENGERIYGDWSEVKSVYANRLGTANQVMYKAGITKLTAGKTSVAVNLKKVAFTKNPVKITYQIAYKKKGATKFSYAYTTNLKKTVYNLSKNTNYQFKVRYYYKSLVDDKLVFSPYTALKTVKTAK